MLSNSRIFFKSVLTISQPFKKEKNESRFSNIELEEYLIPIAENSVLKLSNGLIQNLGRQLQHKSGLGLAMAVLSGCLC